MCADLADLRREYMNRPLRRRDLDADPMVQFDRWFRAAQDVEAMDANAMTLVTANAQSQPSARTVLLKSFDARGFVFYTNLGSAKAADIKVNAEVALLFYWHELHRQVGVRGVAEALSNDENRAYFSRRPRDSQLGAWASPQSQPVESREVLERSFSEREQQFANRDVPLPEFWGGFRILPARIEFWQGRESRLHDRFVYTQEKSGWTIVRLGP